MTRREKLITRLCEVPVDFSWDDLVTVLDAYGYKDATGGGSSHRRFYNSETGQVISGLVKPHGSDKHVKRAYLRKVIAHLNLGQE